MVLGTWREATYGSDCRSAIHGKEIRLTIIQILHKPDSSPMHIDHFVM